MNLNIVIVIIIALIVFYFLFIRNSKNNKSGTAYGNYYDIQNYIEQLVISEESDAFIIITIKGTNDFLQLTGNTSEIQIDFPLITKQQKQNEDKIILAAKKLNLDYIYNTGSDGSKFLDFNIKNNVSNISQVTKNLLIEVFKVDENTVLEFEYNGFIIHEAT
jgi:hypothetical protein